MAKGPSPYKGHPKSEWAEIKANLDAKRSITSADTRKEAKVSDVGQVSVTDIRASAPPVIPPNLFSGDQMSLEVLGLDGSREEPIPGFVLYWFNDVDIRISRARRSGYEFVSREEVMLNDELSDGSDVSGNHVRKLVEKNGEKPVYAYLMKKPKWIKEAHDLEYNKVNDRVEEMVRRGQLSKNPQEANQYVNDGRGKSNLPQNTADTKLYTSR